MNTNSKFHGVDLGGKLEPTKPSSKWMVIGLIVVGIFITSIIVLTIIKDKDEESIQQTEPSIDLSVIPEKELLMLNRPPYIEYGSRTIFYDMKNNNHMEAIRDMSLFDEGNYGTDIDNLIQKQYTIGSFANFNNANHFFVSYWQMNKSFINANGENKFAILKTTDLQYKVDNWQDDRLEHTQIIGVNPVSDVCPNSPVVCFKSEDDLVYVIHELNPNLKISVNGIVKTNLRVIDAERIDNDTIIVRIDAEDIMPEPQYHYILPAMTLFVPFEMIEIDQCFWDSDPRLCKIEQKLASLESAKPISTGVVQDE